MKLSLLDILRCPFDGQKLNLIEFKLKENQKGLVEEGILYCLNCRRWFPVIRGIPKILPDDLRESQELNFLYEHQDEIPLEIKKEGGLFNLDKNIAPSEQPKAAGDFVYKRQMILERDRQADLYDERYQREQNAVEIPTTLKRLDLKKDDFLLDIGAGTGRFTESYITCCREAAALDLSFESLLVLKKKMEDKGFSNIHLLQCDLDFLPFKAEVFDKVLSTEVFQDIISAQSVKQGLFQIKRVLKEKGILVISVYNHSWVKKLYHRIGKAGVADKQGYHSRGKIFYYNFSSRELRKLLDDYFKIVELGGILNGIPQISKRLSHKLRIKFDFFMERTPLSLIFGHLLLAKCQKGL